MKDQRRDLVTHLRSELAAARERAAASFSPEALREAMTTSAKLGYAECRIEPTLPVPVQNTETVRKGLKYLDSLKVNYVWEPGAAPPRGADNPVGSREEHQILVVTLC